MLQGGQDSVVGLINAFVHVIMYTYYLLAAIGPQMQPYLWWKRYLTKLQLVQFVVGFAHSFVVAAGLVQCGYPWQFCAVTCSVLALMMLLFGHFYFEEYVRKKANKQA